MTVTLQYMADCPNWRTALVNVREALRVAGLMDEVRLVVTVSDAEVVITGQVPSFYFKQLAQETLKPSAGLRRILNRVEVDAS